MRSRLNGRVTDCILLYYRTGASGVQDLLPSGFVLDKFGGWAFWNISLCRVRVGGVRFCRAAFSLLTTRGLYVVKMEVDRIAEGLPLHFGTAKAKIQLVSGVSTVDYSVSDGTIVSATAADVETLNPGSCFQFVDEAWEFLNNRNTSYSFDQLKRTVRAITESAHREFSHETPLRVTEARFEFPEKTEAFLETAIHVSPFDVDWAIEDKKGGAGYACGPALSGKEVHR